MRKRSGEGRAKHLEWVCVTVVIDWSVCVVGGVGAVFVGLEGVSGFCFVCAVGWIFMSVFARERGCLVVCIVRSHVDLVVV